MKTQKELIELMSSFSPTRMNVHVHTHVCDGQSDMTVENIAGEAERQGIDLIVLTPHFHRKVHDESATLYETSCVSIFTVLRDEIERYSKAGGAVRFLLSSEVDILSTAGNICITPCAEIEAALDLITPTLNYHPLLPLRFVGLTMGKYRDGLHESGEFAKAAQAAGGVETILESLYDTQANAILNSPYPSMIGHFLAAHSVHTVTEGKGNNWFSARPEHEPLMKAGMTRVLEACVKKSAMVDLTGIHLGEGSLESLIKNEKFLHNLNLWFLEQCNRMNVPAYYGSDAHWLGSIGESSFYPEYFGVKRRK